MFLFVVVVVVAGWVWNGGTFHILKCTASALNPQESLSWNGFGAA